jgi:hypothetical protein
VVILRGVKMGEANKQNYKLPDGYEVVQLEDMAPSADIHY